MKTFSALLVGALTLAVVAVLLTKNSTVADSLSGIFSTLSSWISNAMGPSTQSGSASNSTSDPIQPSSPSGTSNPSSTPASGLSSLPWSIIPATPNIAPMSALIPPTTVH